MQVADIINLIKASIAMFIIVDPLSSVPIFLALTKKASASEKAKAAGEAAFVAALALVAFIILGLPTLALMGITLDSFKIAGGLVLLIVGIYTVLGIPFTEKSENLDVAVVLLAVPMITGPGAMSMAIILTQQYGLFISIGASLLAVFVTWIILRSASSIQKYLGKHGLEIYSRLFGLFIAAFAIQFIAEGVRGMVAGNGG
ncbi:MAG: MarC family protein [Candidatus Micrarchaeota archaeon]